MHSPRLLKTGVVVATLALSGAASLLQAQPLPTGSRLKDLASKAGLLIGVRTFMMGAEYNTIVEREFNTGTQTYFTRWDNACTGKGQHNYSSFNTGVSWLYDRQMKPMEHLLFSNNLYEPTWVVNTTSAAALDCLPSRRRVFSISPPRSGANERHLSARSKPPAAD